MNLIYLPWELPSFSLATLSFSKTPTLSHHGATLVSFAVLWLRRHSFTISSHSFLRIDFAPRSFSPYDLDQNTKYSAHKFFRYPLKKLLQSKDHNLDRQVHRSWPTPFHIHLLEDTHQCFTRHVQQAFRCVHGGLGRCHSSWAWATPYS